MTMQGQTLPPPPLPPPPRQPPTTQIPIPSSVLQAVYASDQEMYPVALSYSRLRAWVEACPDLSICFQNSTAPTGEESAAAAAGVVIVLPLKRVYWEDLLVGRLKEPEIEPEEMFPACGEGCHGEDEGEGEREEVGLHVYHIERFGSWTEGAGGGVGRKGFARFALEEVMRRVRAEKGWKVVGWSGLWFSHFHHAYESEDANGGMCPGIQRLQLPRRGGGRLRSWGSCRQVTRSCLWPAFLKTEPASNHWRWFASFQVSRIRLK